MATSREKPAGRDSGFALLIVLLTLALLGIVTARLLAGARTELAVAGNLRAAAMAGAAASGGITEAIIHLEAPAADPRAQHWSIGGPAHRLRIGAFAVAIRLASIDGLINPNSAPPALLAALLRVSGETPEAAQRIAQAIIAWRSPAPTLAAAQALDAAYRRAGRPGGPDGTSFPTIDALAGVLGMTPALMDRLRPHLSLYAPALPNPALADPVTRAALGLAGSLSVPGIPVDLAPIAQIEAQACNAAGACAFRCDTVTLTPADVSHPYQIMTATNETCSDKAT